MSESDSGAEGPNDDSTDGKTILYCMTREALRASDLEALRDALEGSPFFLRASESGENLMVMRESDESPNNFDLREALSE